MAAFANAMQPGTVLCCLCGLNIPPNPANMCGNCIRSQARGAAQFCGTRGGALRQAAAWGLLPLLQVDITEGIQKQCTVLWCKECNRWLNVRALRALRRAQAPRRN